MYPFLSVLIGGAALALAHRDRRWAYVVGLVAGMARGVFGTSLSETTLPTRHEFWGGPANTYKYLTDSNTDWVNS